MLKTEEPSGRMEGVKDRAVAKFVEKLKTEAGEKEFVPARWLPPRLSCAIQHLTSVAASKVTGAIDDEKEVPIFQVAIYGLIGDFLKVLSELQNAR